MKKHCPKELLEACQGIANSIHKDPTLFLENLDGEEQRARVKAWMDDPNHLLTSLLTIVERAYIKAALEKES